MGKRFCGQCGAPNDESAKFCINCGAPLGEWQETRNAEPDRVIYTSIAPRSIALSIVLSIITFGIYGLYWIYKINNEVNELAEDPIAPGGGMVIFLMIARIRSTRFWNKKDMLRQKEQAGKAGIVICHRRIGHNKTRGQSPGFFSFDSAAVNSAGCSATR